MNVLFSSVGRRVELVRAFKRSFARSGVDATLVGTDISWLAPGFQEVDVACLVPSCADTSFPTAVADICRRYSIDIVLPFIDPEIPVLAAHRTAIESTGARLAVVESAAAEIAADKWKAYQFFERLGLPTPRSWLPTEVDAIEDDQFPLFLKPRQGSAAAFTFKAVDRPQLEFFCSYVPDPIIQEFLPGPEITTDVICDFAGEPQAIVSRQRIAVRGGEAIQSVTIPNDSVRDACQLIAKQLPACGPITVQCMLKGSVPHFIEINARLGGGLPLAIAADVDVPNLLRRIVCNPVSNEELVSSYKSGVYMTRCDESFFIEESFRERIEGDHFRS